MAKIPSWWQPWMPHPNSPAFRHVDWSRHPKAKKGPDGVSVYVIANADGRHVKVGIARDPLKRLQSLQTANPGKLAIASVTGPHPRKIAESIEKRAHAALKDCRAAGEWFRCTVQDAESAVRAAAGITG